MKHFAALLFVALSALAHAQQSSGSSNTYVGPNVPADNRSRDSTLNPYRASPQTGGGGGSASCDAGTMNWTQAGNSCSAAYAGGTSGSSSTVQDNTGTTVGVATVTCTNGSAAAVGTCSTVSDCTSQAVAWTVSGQTCSATAASTTSGSSTSVTDSAGTTQGAATFSCSNGNFTVQSGATCSAAAACSSQSLSWTVGSRSCSATYPGGDSGTSATVNDLSGTTTGSAVATCTNGSVNTSSTTCASGNACSSQTVNWSVSGNSCSASYGGGPTGDVETITDSTGSATGSTTVTCSNGSVSTSGSSCSSSGGSSCSSQTVNWTVSGNSCSASYSGGTSGSSTTISDTAGSVTGSTTATCTNGTVSTSGSTCSTSAASCSAQTVNWTAGGNSCSASYSGGSSGSSSTVTDSTAPLTGSASASCSNGTVSVSGGTCASSGTTCAAGQSVQWVVSSRLCTGTSSSASSGAQITVNASGTNSGTALFTCQSSGSFVYAGGGSCNAGGTGDGGTACGSFPAGVGWGTATSGGACQLNDAVPATPSGQQVQVVDNAGMFQGQATGVCNNGTWSLLSTSCYQATGGPPACAQTTQSWTVGGVTCLGSLPNGDQGLDWAGYDADTTTSTGTAGSTGTKYYTCSSSGWVADSSQPAATCAGGSPSPCPSMTPSWTVSGNTCTGTLLQTNHGGSVSVPNEAANLQGSANYSCSNGTWTRQAGATCAPATVGCPSVFNEWSDTGFCNTPGDSARCCSATFPSLAHGGSGTVQDSSGTSIGSLQSSCSNGTRSFGPALSCTLRCAAVPPGTYTESQFGCNVGADNANASMSMTDKGSTKTLTFSGTTTSVTVQCSDPGGPNYGYTFVSLNTCN